MRLHIDGNGTSLSPHLLGEIAERLEALNAPDEDIFEAWVTLEPPGSSQPYPNQTRVELLLAGRTLCVTHRGVTRRDAVNRALRAMAHQLETFRLLRPARDVRKPRVHNHPSPRKGTGGQ